MDNVTPATKHLATSSEPLPESTSPGHALARPESAQDTPPLFVEVQIRARLQPGQESLPNRPDALHQKSAASQKLAQSHSPQRGELAPPWLALGLQQALIAIFGADALEAQIQGFSVSQSYQPFCTKVTLPGEDAA